MTGIMYHDNGNDNPVSVGEEARRIEQSWGTSWSSYITPAYVLKSDYDKLAAKFEDLEKKLILLGLEKLFDDSDEHKRKLVERYEERLKKIEGILEKPVSFKIGDKNE